MTVDQTMLVVDAMTGQDAVNVATTFNEKIGIDGVILTKLDGDTRGGAALSIKARDRKTDSLCRYGRKALRSGTVLSGSHGIHESLAWAMCLTLIEKAEAQDRLMRESKRDGAEAAQSTV